MGGKLDFSRFIDTKKLKTMLAGFKSINIFDSLFAPLKQAIKESEQESLDDHDFLKECKRRQQTTAGYLTGKILVALGVIEERQLTEALKRQREIQEKGMRKSLGILLVEMGYTTSKEYLEALSRYFHMPIISLLKFIPSPSLQTSLVDRYAYNHKLLVLAEHETEVNLVLAEPNLLILDEVKKIFSRKKINFFLANPFELEQCFRMYSDPYAATFYH
jgi:hypothetical protein